MLENKKTQKIPQNSLKLDSDLLNPQGPRDEEIIASFFTTAPKLLTTMSITPSASPPSDDHIYDRRQFWIRLANTPERREQAAILVDRMYARQGYQHENILRKTPNTITLITYSRDGNVIGTITMGIDSPEDGLLADEGYREIIDKLRSQGKKICEFNGLAIDSSVQSKLVVARLFHIAMLYPWGIFDHKDLIIEVTPLHSRFYKRMLGFNQIGEERVCPRVNTTGVLMHLSLDWADERIREVGGLGDQVPNDHTLYPYFFGKVDASGILGRLKRMVCD